MLESQSPADRRSFLTSLITGAGAAVLGLAGCASSSRGGRPPRPLERSDVIDGARRFFTLESGITYLNNGSLGSCPRPVTDAVIGAMLALNANPSKAYWTDLEPVIDVVRKKAARLFGVTTGEVALTRNTTEGMNIVANGLALRAGDEVLCSSREHPGGLLCWNYLADRIGIRVRTFEAPMPPDRPEQLVDLVRKNLRRETRVVSLCHVVSATGLVYPLNRISELVRPQGIFLVVDGAHPPGMMEVRLRGLGVDTYASSAHKWLCAPRGTGLLYVRREVQDEIRPLIAGRKEYRALDARRYDAFGTRNLPAVIGLGAALDFYEKIGARRVEAEVRMLSGRFREAMRSMPGVRLLTSEHRNLAAGVTAVGFKTQDRHRVQKELWGRHRIWVKPLPDDDLNAIRVSTHYYNTIRDVDLLIKALRSLV